MWTFLLSATGRNIALAAVVLALVFGAIWLIERRAADRALAKIERANAVKMNEADEAERRVLTCPPGLWDKDKRICAIKQH